MIVDYQAKGSGAGIQDLINHTVDFAASDAGMTDEEIAKVDGGVLLLPMTAGEIVLAYNLPGVTELKLPRDVYPDIFLGNITQWNDPRIAAANPGVTLPDTKITVVRRSDSSGTTFVFTKHLSAISEAFKAAPARAPPCSGRPRANIVAAPKNDGVTATIKQTPGAIGYIEYGYAKLTKAPTAMLQNAAGKLRRPRRRGRADRPGRREVPQRRRPARLGREPAGGGQPTRSRPSPGCCSTRSRIRRRPRCCASMVEYSLTEGQKIADSMGYIPLPAPVVEKVRAATAAIM